jgi:predicted dehydrogenase
LIGAGYWGAQLVRTLATHPEAELAMVTDVDPQRLHGIDVSIERATSVAALCAAPTIDAVMVATPPATHFALAREVLRADKHCWVEKPLTLRPDHAAELVALGHARQRTLFVDETFLYDPLVRRAKDWIDAGRLGRVYHFSFERLSLGRVRCDSDIWWNAGSHDLALLRVLSPHAVTAIRVDRFAYVQPNVADVCIGSAQLEAGGSAHFYMSWLSPVKMGRTVAVGSKGMFIYDGRFGARSLTFYEYRTPNPVTARGNVIPIEQFIAIETIPGGDEEPLALTVTAFVHSVRTREPAPSDGVYSHHTVALLAAAEATQPSNG